MAACRIEVARWPNDLEVARRLLRNYERHLLANPAGAASICLVGYEEELAELATRWCEPDGALLLGVLDGVAAGCVAVRMLAKRPGSAEMKRLWVEPAGRGHGLGRQLAETAIVWARTHGAAEVLLDTVPAAMPEANRLYAALGFEPAARYNGNEVDGIVFYRLVLP